MGFIVDGVEEVLNLTQDDLEKTPDFGMKPATEYLLGMANVKGKIIALLDIDQVVDKVRSKGATKLLPLKRTPLTNPQNESTLESKSYEKLGHRKKTGLRAHPRDPHHRSARPRLLAKN